MPIRLITATALVSTALLLSACSRPPASPPPSSTADVVGRWYLVEGDSATVLELNQDGTGVAFEALVDALRGQLPGLGPPRQLRYSIASGSLQLDFAEEPDVALEVMTTSDDALIVESTDDDAWTGTWLRDFE